jgi:hypothetical protein
MFLRKVLAHVNINLISFKRDICAIGSRGRPLPDLLGDSLFPPHNG